MGPDEKDAAVGPEFGVSDDDDVVVNDGNIVVLPLGARAALKDGLDVED